MNARGLDWLDADAIAEAPEIPTLGEIVRDLLGTVVERLTRWPARRAKVARDAVRFEGARRRNQ